MKKPLLLAAISLAAILLLAGCGSGGSTAAEAGASAQQAAETDAATATETNETVESGNDASVPTETTAESVSGNASSENTAVSGSPTVYFTSDISAEGLVRIYELFQVRRPYTLRPTSLPKDLSGSTRHSAGLLPEKQLSKYRPASLPQATICVLS